MDVYIWVSLMGIAGLVAISELQAKTREAMGVWEGSMGI